MGLLCKEADGVTLRLCQASTCHQHHSQQDPGGNRRELTDLRGIAANVIDRAEDALLHKVTKRDILRVQMLRL